jgi:hypothetical protein
MMAFDHMRVRLSQFAWAYKMLDVYKRLFTNDDLDENETTGQQKEAGKLKGGTKQGGAGTAH